MADEIAFHCPPREYVQSRLAEWGVANKSKDDPWAQFRFKAFISYSHADSAFAESLQQQLGAFRTPRRLRGSWTPYGPVPDNAGPVFRDRTDLSASNDLTEALLKQLSDAACLIVVCSTSAAASKWVNEEIQRYRKLGHGGRVLAIIANTAPAGDAKSFFPPALLEAEPIAADARLISNGGEGEQAAFMKLTAGVLGVNASELEEQQNLTLVRQAQNARRMAAIFGVLLVGAVVGIGVAVSATLSATHNLTLAQTTISDVLKILDGDENQYVWGFEDTESRLVDRLIDAQQKLRRPTGDRRDAFVTATAALKQARIVRSRGDMEQAALNTRKAHDAILPVALRADATLDERVLALKASYYLFELGTDEDEIRALDQTRPLVEPALADQPDAEFLRWAALYYNNLRAKKYSEADYAGALVATERANEIAARALKYFPSIDTKVDAFLALTGRVPVLRRLEKAEEADSSRSEGCQLVRSAHLAAPAHREALSGAIWCLFEDFTQAFNRADIDGANRALNEVLSLAETAARFGPAETRWRAAVATVMMQRGQMELLLKKDPYAAQVQYEKALNIWFDIYGEQPIAPRSYNSLSETVSGLLDSFNQIEAKEPSNRDLKIAHFERLLEIHHALAACARKLKGRSECGAVAREAVQRAAELGFDLDRSNDLIEPLRLAVSLSADRENVPALRKYSDTFNAACSLKKGLGRALTESGRADEAVVSLRTALTACRDWLKTYDYDYYLRQNVSSLSVYLSEALLAVEKPEDARLVLKECVEEFGSFCYDKYADMLSQGVGGPVDDAEASRVRMLEPFTNIKRFTVPVSEKGSVATIPFHVYVFMRPPNWKYLGIEDQAQWLEINRGLVVPQDVRDSFVKLEKLALDNKISFPDLAVYALGASNKPAVPANSAMKDKDPKSQSTGSSSADEPWTDPIAALRVKMQSERKWSSEAELAFAMVDRLSGPEEITGSDNSYEWAMLPQLLAGPVNRADNAAAKNTLDRVLRVLDRLEKTPTSSANPDLRLSRALNAIVNYASSIKDYAVAAKYGRRYLELQRKEQVRTGANKDELVSALGNQSWHELLTGSYAVARDLAREAYALDRKVGWVQANEAHALLLLGEVDPARRIYLAHSKDKVFNRPWIDVMRDDFSELKSHGFGSPDMERILAELEAISH